MALELSVSGETLWLIQESIKSKSREWLEVVFAEWRASQDNKGEITHQFDERKYQRALKFAQQEKIHDEWLADFIIERATEFRTSTNGGWEAYSCPYGCVPHLISLDTENEQ